MSLQENSFTMGGGPCQINCFEEVAPIIGEGREVDPLWYVPSPLHPTPCETCEDQDSCKSDEPHGDQFYPIYKAARVSPRWACRDPASRVLAGADSRSHDAVSCPSSHLPVVCPVSGGLVEQQTQHCPDHAATPQSGFTGAPCSFGRAHWAPGADTSIRGIAVPRDDSAEPGNTFAKAAFSAMPCRATAKDAELEDLRAVDTATFWDDGRGSVHALFWSCSRTRGPLSVPLARVGLNGFLPREGFKMPEYVKAGDGGVPDWYHSYNRWVLLQDCPAVGVAGSPGYYPSSTAKQPTCRGFSLGQCRHACETYPTFADGTCCDEETPKHSPERKDFFGRTCRKRLRMDYAKKRCHACTGFLFHPTNGECSLTSQNATAAYAGYRFKPHHGIDRRMVDSEDEERSEHGQGTNVEDWVDHTSTFYTRERILGHLPGFMKTCPMLSSGHRYTSTPLSPYAVGGGDADVSSDLEHCQDVETRVSVDDEPGLAGEYTRFQQARVMALIREDQQNAATASSRLKRRTNRDLLLHTVRNGTHVPQKRRMLTTGAGARLRAGSALLPRNVSVTRREASHNFVALPPAAPMGLWPSAVGGDERSRGKPALMVEAEQQA